MHSPVMCTCVVLVWQQAVSAKTILNRRRENIFAQNLYTYQCKAWEGGGGGCGHWAGI